MLLMPHMVVIAHKMVCGYSYVSTYGYGGHCISEHEMDASITYTSYTYRPNAYAAYHPYAYTAYKP